MLSRLIGQIQLNNEKLKHDLNILENAPKSDAYKEYAIGEWTTTMLYNKTGLADDGYSVEYEGSAIPTEIGNNLPYLGKIISEIFVMKHLKSVRDFRARNGLIIPHVDYREFKRGFTRIHIPIQTDDNCFNSEEETVYHMKKGEIWILEGRKPHSGGSLSGLSRSHLVLDFDPDIAISDLFKNKKIFNENIQPTLINRPPLSAQDSQAIFNLKHLINSDNYMDTVAMLTKIHFRKKVSCAAIYDWLDSITAPFSELAARSRVMRLQLLGS
jgi:hypothetical protein